MRASRAGGRGFTLIEMLVVLGIMTALAAIAIPVFLSGRATNRRTAAENAVRAALTSARGAAVEHRSTVAVKFVSNLSDPQRGDQMQIWLNRLVWDTAQNKYVAEAKQLGPSIALPDFVKLDIGSSTTEDGWGSGNRNLIYTLKVDGTLYDPGWPDIVYLADGTVGDPVGETDIVLKDTTEKNSFQKEVSTTLKVLTATGLVVEAYHNEDGASGGVSAKGWL